MADTSIKISLELADKAAQKALSDFISQGDKAEKGLNKLGHSASDTFNEIGVHIGKAAGIYDIFVGNLAANVAIKALEVFAEAAHSLFEVFVVEGVHAAAETQVAINNLNVALAQAGQYSKETSKEFVNFAEELSAVTTVSHSQILQNAGLLESFARLDGDGLQRATTASLNLSAALGKDLTSATEALGKAANGNVTSLQKMGIQIEKGQTNAETFEHALAAVEARFDGAAESKVNTYSGAISQAANSFEDLTEQIGNVIVKNPAVIKTINELSIIFQELGASLGDSQQGFAQLAGEGLAKFLEIVAAGVTIVDSFTLILQGMFGALETLLTPVTGLIGIFDVFNKGLDESAAKIRKYNVEANTNFAAFSASGSGALSKVADGLLRLREAAKVGLSEMAQGADGTVEPLNNATHAVDELTEAQKRHQERLKEFVNDLVKQSESAKTGAEAQLTVAKAQAESEIAIAQDLLDRKLISEVEFLSQKQIINENFEATQQDLALKRLQEDQARLEEARVTNHLGDVEYYAAKQQIADNFTTNQIKMDADAFKRDTKMKKDLRDAELKLQKERLGYAADTFGNLASLMRTSSKELFAIGKAAALAQSLINTYQAITVTMASVPYPFNVPLAVAQGIAGAVQISNIASTQPSFADGGIVPGTSYAGDNVAANVNSGEMILNRAQQAHLFNVANGGQGDGSSKIESLLAQLVGAVQSQPIVVNIGGRTVVDTLRSELSSGRSFA